MIRLAISRSNHQTTTASFLRSGYLLLRLEDGSYYGSPAHVAQNFSGSSGLHHVRLLALTPGFEGKASIKKPVCHASLSPCTGLCRAYAWARTSRHTSAV